MKLSRESILELRKKIKEEIEKGYNQCISIENELLEKLIFDTRIDKKTGDIIKYPVWTGEFLDKIDLSEVDFSNVCWDARDEAYDESGHYIDLSSTNAKIDFNTSYGKIIRNCNFCECQDLLNIDTMEQIYNSDFSNCDIDICPLLDKIQGIKSDNDYKNYVFQNSKLNGCQICCYDYNFNIDKCDYLSIVNSNFTGTTINFICDLSNKATLEKVLEMIKNNRIGGCYLNGKYVHTKKEIKKIKAENSVKNYDYKKAIVKSIFKK